MNIWISDTETTPILRDDSTEKMWIIGGKNLATGEVVRFFPFQGKDQVKKAIDWASSVDTWIGHNFLAFDTPQINTHLGQKVVDPTKVIDTLVLSRLVYYDRPIPPGGDSAHSLKSWGIRLGCYKGDFHSFNSYSQEMLDYWEQDLEVNHKLYLHLKRFLDDPEWQRSIRVEHDTQIELIRQKFYGFRFNKPKAELLLKDILSEKDTLEKKIEESFPPQLKLVHTVQYRTKKDGSEFATVTKAKEKYSLTKVNGDMLDCYEYVPFNPGSPVDRIDALWDAKWKPFEKTKTHQKFGRLKPGDPYGKSVESMSEDFYENKKKHFERYGWVVNEDNLSTLPDTAPEGARLLAQWLTLEGRRSSLVEWLGQVRPDNRIHGTTNHIGAWTHRFSHSNPNLANISSAFHGEPTNPIEEVKHRYDGKFRELWTVPEGSWLVGCDAAGIQLRILAHLMRSDAYVEAIVSGKKEDETDIHNLNRKALGMSHVTRDMAKTYVYAFLLGAGTAKLASILKVSQREAKEATETFIQTIPGLAKLKKLVIPEVAKKGWFKGLDGRKVIVPNEHKTLAGMLQNGEAVVIKHSLIEWNKRCRENKLVAKLCAIPHDEYQTQVDGTEDQAHEVGAIQRQSIIDVGERLNLFCPMDGEYRVGSTWLATH